MSQKEEKNLAKALIVIAIVIAVVAVYFIMTSSIKDKPIAGRGAQIDRQGDADIGGEFALIDQNNQSFGSEKLKGKTSLIYFGFSFCPDICPTSLNKMAKVVDTLGKYNIDVTPVFISLDPERDTPEILQKYLLTFGDKFVGLTGDKEKVKAVADKFKVFYALAPGSNVGSNGYLLDHTSLVYIMDKNGKYMHHFHIDSSPEEIIEYLRVNAN